MKKICLITFLLIIMVSLAPAEDLSDDPIGIIRINTEANIRMVSEKQTLLLENVSQTLNDANPAFDTVISLKNNGMAKLFVFDEKRIMHKEVSYENRIFSSKMLNHHYVGLEKAEMGKVYLSPMFLYKNKAYYLLGAKNETTSLMMLFFVPEVESKRYAIFHDDGSILINKMGLNKSRIAEFAKSITSENEADKKAIKAEEFTVFRPEKKYFLIRE